MNRKDFSSMNDYDEARKTSYREVQSHCTEVRFVSFLSVGFITAIVVNSPKRKLAKCTSVHCTAAFDQLNTFLKTPVMSVEPVKKRHTIKKEYSMHVTNLLQIFFFGLR